jgi:hypothetical protein
MSDESKTVDLGESFMYVKEGQSDRGTSVRPSKPINITPPKILPIPPAAPNSGIGNKK